MKFHVQVRWSRTGNWSGWYEAVTPGEALARAARAVARKAQVDERIIEVRAQFIVMGESAFSSDTVTMVQHAGQPEN